MLRFLTSAIICSHFLRTCGTHQLNAGSSSKLWATAYSATSIGCDSFKSESFSHDVDPSLHWTQSCQPLVKRRMKVLSSATPTSPVHFRHSTCATISTFTIISYVEQKDDRDHPLGHPSIAKLSCKNCTNECHKTARTMAFTRSPPCVDPWQLQLVRRG